MSVPEKRQLKHLAVVEAANRLEMAVAGLESMLLEMNPGLKPPPTESATRDHGVNPETTFSEVWHDLPGTLHSLTDRVQRAREEIYSQLF
jgi:hypothetical protein